MQTFSPDGQLLVIAKFERYNERSSHTGPLYVWDLGKRQLRWVSLKGDASILEAMFSPDGSHLAATDVKRRLHLWNVATGKELADVKFESFNGLGARFALVPGRPFSSTVALAHTRNYVRLHLHRLSRR
jgi:WD40 repeat protein